MNILETIDRALVPRGAPAGVRRKDIGSGDPGMGAAFGALAGTSGTKTGNYKAILEQYQSWVYAAGSFVAQAIAAVELHLYDAGDNEIESHPFLDFWEQPCPAFYRAEFVEMWTIHRLLVGNSYWGIVGNMDELWPLFPHLMTIKPGKKDPQTGAMPKFIDHFEYKSGAEVVNLAPEVVIHAKTANPRSLYYGLGVAEANGLAIDMNAFIHEHAVATFRNSAVPKGFWKFEKGTPPGERRRFTRLLEQLRGPASAGRSMVGVSGVDWQQVQMSAQEIDFLNSAHFTRDEIFALFNVPRAMVGMSDDINRANAEAASAQFAQYALQPHLTALATVLNKRVVPAFGQGLYVRFEEVVPEDVSSTAAKVTAMTAGSSVRANEWREAQGLDADPALDDYLVTPTGLIPVPGSGAADLYVTPDVTQNPQDANATTDDQGQENVPAGKRQKATRPPARPVVDSHASQVASALREFLGASKNRTLGRLRNEAKAVAKGTESEAFQPDPERRMLAETLAALLLGAYLAGIEWAITTLGWSVYVHRADAERWAGDRSEYAAGLIVQTLEKRIGAAISAIQSTGGSSAELLDAIGRQFDIAITVRADMAGLQESSTAFHAGALEAGVRGGVERKAWITVHDGHVEAVCAANGAAGALPIGDPFPSGDAAPPTHAHFGCRCEIDFPPPGKALPAPENQSMPQVVVQIEKGDPDPALQRILESMEAALERVADRPIDVQVAAPIVNVEPPQVEVLVPARSKRIERDADGRIAKVVEE